jgi:hypothetical protein
MLNLQKQKILPELQKHKIFDELSEYINFYDFLCDSGNLYHDLIISNKKPLFLDSLIIESMKDTVESIKCLLQNGKVNDAYTLTRKYYDLVVINIFEILILEDLRLEEYNSDNQIKLWVDGKEKLPVYKDMIIRIKNSKTLKNVNKILDLDNYYKKIKERCNNHVHYNLLYCLRLNNIDVLNEYPKHTLKFLDELADDIRDIFIMHYVMLFTLKGYCMSSSDYVDSLECGITPEEGSQYYVAPFVQKVFNEIIKKHRMDLALELQSNTYMKLE